MFDKKQIHTVASYAEKIGKTSARVWQLIKEDKDSFVILKRGSTTIIIEK